jgi:CPA1 family monovalent cation:H+ antiporter
MRCFYQRVRLGSGDFFCEMALLSKQRRQADVVALGYCQVLVLNVTEFRRFLREYPAAKAEIDRVAATVPERMRSAARINKRTLPRPRRLKMGPCSIASKTR